MEVEITVTAEKRLEAHAKAAGYDDVQRFAALQLEAIAREPTPDELPPLSAAQLAESEAMIKEGEADIAAGKTRELRAGLLEIGRGLGIDLGGVDICE